jgi:hypothetical protein
MKELLAVIDENTIMIIPCDGAGDHLHRDDSGFPLEPSHDLHPAADRQPFSLCVFTVCTLPGWRDDVPACRGHHRIIVGDEMGVG